MPEQAQRDRAEVAPSPWDGDAKLAGRPCNEDYHRDAVESVIATMRDRIDGPFRLEEMARIAYLSPFHFNRVFRQMTGIPPGRFHTALRIAAAKRLLLTTDLSVTEICFEIGYQSLGTFTTHFHDLVGVSPRGLRRLASEPAQPPDELRSPPCANGAEPGAPAVEGRVLGQTSDWLTLVGLFADPYPHRLPMACAAVAGSGRFALHTQAAGRFHVAAAAFPRSDDVLGCLLPEQESIFVALSGSAVGLGHGRSIVRDLRLRRLRATDPPILVALPLGAAREIAGLATPATPHGC